MPDTAHTPSAAPLDRSALRHTGAARRVDKSLPRNLRSMLALQDFEEPARRYLPKPMYGYVSGGTENNVSLRNNREAFDDYSLVPRSLVNVSGRNTKATLFGHTYDAPFGFSPMGGTSMAAFRGDTLLAAAAAEANIPMIMSGASLQRLEDVRAAGRTTWFQAYLPGEEKPITELVNRVAAAGFETLVLTVDVPVGANRENNVRSGFSRPLRPTWPLAWQSAIHPRWFFGMFMKTLLTDGMPHFENMGHRTALVTRKGERDRGRRDQMSWKEVEMMRRMWKGKFVLKGVLSKEDAHIARESGVDGVIVSNHGGRQLDSSAAPLRVLPGIVDEAGDMAVMMDSGVRRGTDVLKALAIGAKFVFIGRPFLYAAAIGGEAGVRHAIKLLQDEVDRDMALMGISKLTDMRRELLMETRGKR
jgi:L-lactate dehydrogenase (cytochrome)